ncbi:hypothetical protein TL16_g08684 [Triparma laevis f. inornata]|uniref:Uncharacterized protein n=1 Tax=Triparma laevis f. inornata TaxID=1714386 RepID=A0A9W7AZ51_9STRA|nr:hypothetical protein TL16_g08684 [Triparma laevis f. inornata]
MSADWIEGMDEDIFESLTLPNPASKSNPDKVIAMTPTVMAEVCQVCCTLSTLGLLYLRYDSYMFEHSLKESLWNNVVKLDFIYDYVEFRNFVVEMCVLAIHPIPFAGSQNIAVCLMFFRFYLFLHLLRDHSVIYKSRRDIIVKIFSKIPNPQFNWFQTVQFEIDQNPVRFMLVLTTYYFFVFSYCIYVIEREYNPIDYTLLYGCWHTITHSAASYIQERFRFILYRQRQERMRSKNKTLSMIDEAEMYAKKETKHKQRQAQRLLEFHKCRRFKFLKSNSAGDPFVDKLNAIGRICEKVHFNTRKEEVKEDIVSAWAGMAGSRTTSPMPLQRTLKEE